MDSCSFCGETAETLVHLFWNRQHTQAFWKKLIEWMSQKIVNLKDSAFCLFLCLGLVENASNVLLHHLLLIARHYIYTCKLKNSIPKLQVYLQHKCRQTEAYLKGNLLIGLETLGLAMFQRNLPSLSWVNFLVGNYHCGQAKSLIFKALYIFLGLLPVLIAASVQKKG